MACRMVIRSSLLPALVVCFGTVAVQPQDDPILTALEAELERSVAGFGQNAEQPPYYIGYAAWDRWGDLLTAGSGSILVDRRIRQRVFDADLRVGDFELDNTRRLQGGRGAPAPSTGVTALPLDADVDAIRAAIWRRTESDYRAALERLRQVEANQAATVEAADTSGDFSREEPHVRLDAVTPPAALDRDLWSDRLRRLSARFDGHPDIHSAVITLTTAHDVRYLVTSEGTRVRGADTRVRLTISADSHSDDGSDLDRRRAFEAPSPDQLPSEDELAAAVDAVIRDLDALRAAPEVEPYSGPAILSGRASAVFFHEIFGHRIEGHRQKDESFAQTFTSQLGETVLPSFLSVVDDPTRRAMGDVELAGHYMVDDEGVPARSVQLIENGVLSGFLMGRSPIAAAPHSNGHGRRQAGRLAVARQGNLIVTSTQTVSQEQLRARLLEEIRRQGKEYGYRFEDIEGGFTFTGRITPQSFKVLPVEVYRVYADGRPDELVRGADIVGTPLTVFSKIVATDDQPQVFNGTCGAESGSVPVSAVSPGILISELEIEKRAKSLQRPPVLAVPPGSRGGAEVPAQNEDDAVLFQALEDEMARSMDSLRLDGLASPHHMSYRVEDVAELLVDASFGGIVNQSQTRTRRLEADVRVGTPQLDNSNYAEPGMPSLGWVEIGYDDNYGAIRRFAWRITDSRYKLSAEVLGRKQAALESKPAPEAPSFSGDPAQTLIEPAVALHIDEAPWAALARRVSSVFREFPAIEESRTRVHVKHLNRYVVSSDGSRSRTPQTSYVVLVSGIARGPAGTIEDGRVFAAPSAEALGGVDEIVAGTRALAEALTARTAAETIDGYVGPVLLEGRAAPQFFHVLFGRHVAGTPNPVLPARMPSPPARRLESQVGQRVMAAGLDVFDDPTRTEYEGVPLLGHYLLDEEGVAPRAVQIVEDGMLRGFVFSRLPANPEDRSTGHGRDSRAGELRAIVGNLIVEAREPASEEELRAELIRRAQEDGLEFGIIIRDFMDAGLLPAPDGVTRERTELPPPLGVYRLYPDGREEPVRDVDMGEATVRALRDIVAAGGSSYVYNFLQSGGTSVLRWGTTPISVVAPAVLVSELSLRNSESTEPVPILPHPFFDGG